jgi:hypothetical protein
MMPHQDTLMRQVAAHVGFLPNVTLCAFRLVIISVVILCCSPTVFTDLIRNPPCQPQALSSC